MKLENILENFYSSLPGRYVAIEDSLLYVNVFDMSVNLSYSDSTIELKSTDNRIKLYISEIIDVYMSSEVKEDVQRFRDKRIKFFEEESLARVFAGYTNDPGSRYNSCDECPFYEIEDLGYCYHKPHLVRKCNFLKLEVVNAPLEMKCRRERS